MAGPVLDVRGLKTSFGRGTSEVTVVNDVNFDLRAGEIVALVGESGSGKSVSALSIMGLLSSNARVKAGEVRFEGQDLARLSSRQMRRLRGDRISMVFQDARSSLNPLHRIVTQIVEMLRLHTDATGAAARKTAHDLLTQVGIVDVDQVLDSYPHQLSGGMCQRVMIAIALACQPSVMLADEPTTALDVTTQAQILDLMQARAAEIGTAVLLITHDLGIVARYAQRVNVMYAGRIVEQGSVDDVFAAPRHPYTRGLLDSVPRLDVPKSDRLDVIPGTPPNPARLPVGCAFRPRCTMAGPGCEAKQSLRPIPETDQSVACWRAIEEATQVRARAVAE